MSIEAAPTQMIHYANDWFNRLFVRPLADPYETMSDGSARIEALYHVFDASVRWTDELSIDPVPKPMRQELGSENDEYSTHPCGNETDFARLFALANYQATPSEMSAFVDEIGGIQALFANDGQLLSADWLKSYRQARLLRELQQHSSQGTYPTVGLAAEYNQQIYDLRRHLRQTDLSFPSRRNLQKQFTFNLHKYDGEEVERPAFFSENWHVPVDMGRLTVIMRPLITFLNHAQTWEQTSATHREAQIAEIMEVFSSESQLVLGALFSTAQEYVDCVNSLYANSLHPDRLGRSTVQLYSMQWWLWVGSLQLGKLLYGKQFEQEFLWNGTQIVYQGPNGTCLPSTIPTTLPTYYDHLNLRQ